MIQQISSGTRRILIRCNISLSVVMTVACFPSNCWCLVRCPRCIYVIRNNVYFYSYVGRYVVDHNGKKKRAWHTNGLSGSGAKLSDSVLPILWLGICSFLKANWCIVTCSHFSCFHNLNQAFRLKLMVCFSISRKLPMQSSCLLEYYKCC